MSLKASRVGTVYSLPLTVWISLFFLIPMVIVVLYSFLTRDTGGGVRWEFTLDAYAAIFKQTSSGQFLYLDILWYTFWMAVAATARAAKTAKRTVRQPSVAPQVKSR